MILVIDNHSVFLPDLQAQLHELSVDYSRRIAFRGVSHEELTSARGVILTGGPVLFDHSLYLSKIASDLTVLLAAQVPILGIGLGHLLIAETYGAEISQLPTMVSSEMEVHVLKRSPIFGGLPDRFPAQVAYSETVRELPDCFEHLASSKHCQYQAVRHQTRLIYGVQFHPEASGETGKQILSNFLHLCGEPAYNGFRPDPSMASNRRNESAMVVSGQQ